VTEVPLEHTSPVTLVALLDRIGQASKALGAALPKGTLLANPERGTILLIADEADRVFWEARIRQFDRPQDAYTLAYTPRRFGVAETAKLLDASVPHQDAPWKVVTDELTGSIVITTTPDVHAEARALFERLESAELGPRRSVRAFPLKHRSVASVAILVQDLVQRGALTSQVLQAGTTPGKESAALLQPGPRPGNEAATDLVITLDEPANRLVAPGEGRLLDQLGDLIESQDVSSPQVLVETLVVNLTDTKTRALGVELRAIAQRGSNLYSLSSLFGLGAPDPNIGSLPATSATGATGVVLDPGDFSGLVRALETINDGRVVTIPKVLVGNNEQAELGSTLQTPYLSTNASSTVATTSFGGSLDAGTTISVKP
jgi:type II secretory pathway component GspD/PulD (secretin)